MLDRFAAAVPNRRAGGSMPAQFRLYLVKPSHYDDDGYVIQWLRSAIPSNSLAVMHGLAEHCRANGEAGEDFDILAMDETNTRVRPEQDRRRDRRRRRPRPRLPRRRAVESVSARRGHRAPPARRRRAGRDRRLPRLGLPVHAAADAGRSQAGAGARRQPVRRRGRGAARPRCCATPSPARCSRSTISCTICRRSKARRSPSSTPRWSSAPRGW